MESCSLDEPYGLYGLLGGCFFRGAQRIHDKYQCYLMVSLLFTVIASGRIKEHARRTIDDVDRKSYLVLLIHVR